MAYIKKELNAEVQTELNKVNGHLASAEIFQITKDIEDGNGTLLAGSFVLHPVIKRVDENNGAYVSFEPLNIDGKQDTMSTYISLFAVSKLFDQEPDLSRKYSEIEKTAKESHKTSRRLCSAGLGVILFGNLLILLTGLFRVSGYAATAVLVFYFLCILTSFLLSVSGWVIAGYQKHLTNRKEKELYGIIDSRDRKILFDRNS